VSGLDAALGSCAIADRSDLGRLLGTGPDLLGLLHRLSTGDVRDLRPGEGRDTVLTNAKGRIVERLSAHHLGEDGVLLIGGPGSAPRVLAHLQKFTFAEKTGLTDRTAATFAFALFGPKWADAARAAGLPSVAPFGVATCEVGGARVRAARTNGFNAEGVLVIGDRASAEPVLGALSAGAEGAGGGIVDAHALEAWRILNGFPAAGHELTEEHNPLEAGLRDAISFTKGCYVGQEVVARLNTYGKVARGIIRLQLQPGAPAPKEGAAVLHDGKSIGTVTSAILPEGRVAAFALAYVKSRELPAGVDSVTIDDAGALRIALIVRA
jgi:aminomethyltransferase